MSNQDSEPDMKLFWGCFIALITTAFAFITRVFLVNDPSFWPSTFSLDSVQAQELFGAGIWPFAISIIVFSLIIDNIGYRAAMIFSFVCYALYAILAFMAYGVVMAEGLSGAALEEAQSEAYNLLYFGSVILGLGNGTVEAFINPVVATMFKKDKTKWLNILHAGWPGGLVIGGVLTIMLNEQTRKTGEFLFTSSQFLRLSTSPCFLKPASQSTNALKLELASGRCLPNSVPLGLLLRGI